MLKQLVEDVVEYTRTYSINEEEWYSLNFAGHNVFANGDNIEIEDSMIEKER